MNMHKITLYIYICIGLLPGALCDNYSYLGLVASSIASGFFFILIIVMIVFGAVWNDWYPNFQEKQGRVKVERIKKKHDSQESIIGSDHKHYSPPSHGVSLPPSRQNTEGRGSKLTQSKLLNASMHPSEKADTWIQEVQPSKFEEKSKEMDFEDEEPFIVVTELLPTTEPVTSTTNENLPPAAISQDSDTKVETFLNSGEIETSVEKQPLQRLSTLPNNKDAVLDMSDEEEEDTAIYKISTNVEGEANMVLY